MKTVRFLPALTRRLSVLLAVVFPIVLSATEAQSPHTTRPFDPPDRELVDIPVYSSRASGQITTLAEWQKNHRKGAVIAIMNRDFPSHFAQLVSLETLCENSRRLNIRFAAVLLHRKPERFLRHFLNTRGSPCDVFTASLDAFSTIQSDPIEPIVLIIDRSGNTIAFESQYCDDDTLSDMIMKLIGSGLLQVEGDS